MNSSTRTDAEAFECRAGCGACCIAPSISSPIPGMPDGKPAGVPCVQLDDDYQCKLFGLPERPRVCGGFQAEPAICGDTREEAIRILSGLEAAGAHQA
ncbi:YkgJ family cysteine cluster protein [Halospina denitrificans]|uniref:YkgJ family cysteine cluster protein n=1 Tax=Halospina denitrificans TaxID=332522 RepID=UPI00105D29CA|nr:YkgJ family cysteine cluster protein [Halospina denitrificans]